MSILSLNSTSITQIKEEAKRILATSRVRMQFKTKQLGSGQTDGLSIDLLSAPTKIGFLIGLTNLNRSPEPINEEEMYYEIYPPYEYDSFYYLKYSYRDKCDSEIFFNSIGVYQTATFVTMVNYIEFEAY